jgi:hypothetical protein
MCVEDRLVVVEIDYKLYKQDKGYETSIIRYFTQKTGEDFNRQVVKMVDSFSRDINKIINQRVWYITVTEPEIKNISYNSYLKKKYT